MLVKRALVSREIAGLRANAIGAHLSGAEPDSGRVKLRCKPKGASYPSALVTMKRILLTIVILLIVQRGWAQVDTEQRRVLAVQTSFGIVHSAEVPGAFGYFWFNENNYPWTNTALRVIYSGIFADGELSWFLPGHSNTALGIGASGGLFLESIMPYQDGDFVKDQSFYGDRTDVRLFIDQALPNGAAIPVNLRGTYRVSGAFYRKSSDTENFDIPNNFLIQSLGAELRVGGIAPGLAATRGVELYLAADVNYRSGYEGFGPVGAHFPEQSEYGRLAGALAGKLPVGPTTVFGRLAGGGGDNLDQLSAWKLGGNIVGSTKFAYPLHGYYTRELFAADFGLGNLDWIVPICPQHSLTGHLYGDWAIIKPPAPAAADWRNYLGIGAGLGFRGPWQTNWLLSYGYGINAVRDGEHGGHEVGLALERSF